MPSSKSVDVSVVIPSVGRPELRRAVESVLAQKYAGRTELIVVFDLDESIANVEMLDSAAGADRILFTGGGKRGGFARNLGVRAANGHWIAFLDDDDTWFPDKLRLQLSAAARQPTESPIVIGSRAVQTLTGSTGISKITGVPQRLISADEDIAAYLFRRRRAGSRRASFFASTVLVPRSLCLRVPWDETLSRHQDWDWLVRVGEQPGVKFHQVNEDLVDIFVGTTGSISAGSDWTTSLAWARTALVGLDPQTRVDFLAGQTLRYAVQKRDLAGIRASVREMAKIRRLPSPSPLLLGVSGLLPRKSLQSLMRVFK
ncbi:glycosyltransferase [Arthrobacter sp. PAMC25564]|uniref:glycosyltransferase family 2 protein n=1 Tax=Arthrobacter sp. PAMC25564 TaxID=2565366 RepID=UPI0010A21318|nr:glycosyltransferase [Arthrobacter sp. PAMC25564]QCB96555.1 glycosyltransferase [Arthrobacter sp. PAMC25564]